MGVRHLPDTAAIRRFDQASRLDPPRRHDDELLELVTLEALAVLDRLERSHPGKVWRIRRDLRWAVRRARKKGLLQ